MKRVLIISPYFPPVNAADMQRVRMSLPFYKEFGWEAEVVAVDPAYCEHPLDELLRQSIPPGIKIHYVKAVPIGISSRIGFGTIAYRSWWFYRQKVNSLLKHNKYDLVYFSTTQFQICTLGAYWKKQFKVPYVIDMQDPWHSDYYQDKPKQQRPRKYWLSYRLNKWLEPIAMKTADGLISVSEKYIQTLRERYPQLNDKPAATITFGAFAPDLKIASDNKQRFENVLDPGFKNLVYIGRGGMDMYKALTPIFEVLSEGIQDNPAAFKQLRLYFIGTSYAPKGGGIATILPLAKQFGLADKVFELTDRIGYYHTLLTLQQADALFIPGSDDPSYTASKIYPYLLTRKPLLAIFNAQSSALNILKEYGAEYSFSYDATDDLKDRITSFLTMMMNNTIGEQHYDSVAEEKYSAKMMAKNQCALFDSVDVKKLRPTD